MRTPVHKNADLSETIVGIFGFHGGADDGTGRFGQEKAAIVDLVNSTRSRNFSVEFDDAPIK